jgi:GNAT superfamily N-acetyltransferase
MGDYEVRPLTVDTWDAFEAFVEKHGGVWGGCWCTWFHTMPSEKARDADANHALKRRLVAEGRAHAALVFDGEVAIGWCQYGAPAELPNIYHRKQYDQEADLVPDYRLTCFFIDHHRRKKGVATAALAGALDLIAEAGGGIVEGYPEDTTEKDKAGKKISASFLYNGTRKMFEDAGFEYVRAKGTKNCVMRTTVPPR